jgi:putative DNA primase/helicase
VAWVNEDVAAVSRGEDGHEAQALAEGERRGYGLAPIQEKYRRAREGWKARQEEPKKIWPETQPGAAVVPAQTRVLQAFATGKSGIPSTYVNAKLALENMALDCRYDVFHDRLLVTGYECRESGEASENLDNVALKVRDEVLRRFGFDPGKNHTFDALVSRALDRQFDPVRDYLDKLAWDGAARIDTWLIDWCGVADTPLNRALGRKTLLAAVRRVKEPGVKYDLVLVLEGEQGSGRSTMLKILAGGDENYSDAEIIGAHAKEVQENIQGVWIYELAELSGIGKVDVLRLKNFVTQTVDRARPAYGRTRIDRRRRCIFVGTTNDDEYLRDHTGNRRFGPVKLPKGWLIDLSGFVEVRDQLWAEAAVMEALVDQYGRREPLEIPPALWGDARVEVAKRETADPWEDVLAGLIGDNGKSGFPRVDGQQADAMGEPEWRVATADLLEHVLGLPPSRQYPSHKTRLVKVMRKLGWDKPDKPFRIMGKTQNGYRRRKA